jgi:nucleotide-binding universal stress UspA family protein
MFKRILVPIDGSPNSEAALGPAFVLAAAFGGEVQLLQVIVPPEAALAAVEGAQYYALQNHWQETEVETAETYLGRLRGQWCRGRVPVAVQAAVGAAPATIVATAEAFRADLIVMSTHGRSGLSRVIYGSVAEAVLRAARVPVLLVPRR